jgi:uncharacterized protein (TIGR03435 family)
MKRNAIQRTAVLAVAALMAVPAMLGQTAADAKPAAVKAPPGGWAFEVATIKPANMPAAADFMNGKAHVGLKTDAARVDIGWMSLSDIICAAYKIKAYQITGPDWITSAGLSSQRFDVLAKMPEGATKEQVPEMLQALLAERFKLAIHHDTKERSVYALVVGKGGAKMKETPAEPPAPALEKAEVAPGEEPAPAAATGPQVKVKTNADGSGTATVHGPDGNAKVSYSMSGMHMELEKLSMEKLAETLTPFLDRPVVDMTELKGNFQVVLDLTMDDLKNIGRKFGAAMPGGGAASSDSSGLPSDAASDPSGSIFKSVQQLGLKLEARKAPVDTIVIDHAEKMPTEN